MKYTAAAAILILHSACDLFSDRDGDREPVARVHDQYLYADALNENIPSGLSEEDSITLARRFIRNWVERRLMVYQAENNLRDEKRNIQKRLEEYKNDLLIYSYQSQLVSQKLDTVVAEEEIREYYENHKDRFLLKDYILKVNYVKLDSNAPRLKEVRDLIMSTDPEDKSKLEDYCFQFAVNFYLDRQNWVYLDDLLKEVPADISSGKDRLLRTRTLIEFRDDDFIYLLKISDALLKGDQSPLSLERENIKNILLNKRKVNFLSKLKEDLFVEAERKNNFEIYK